MMIGNTVERPGGASSVDAQIEFVLGHPDMSDWIKDTLRQALACSPIEVLNDLEILNRVLRAWADGLTAQASCKEGPRP